MHKQLQVRLSFPSDFGCLFILSDCLNAIWEYKPITRAQEDQAPLDVFGPSSSSPGYKQTNYPQRVRNIAIMAEATPVIFHVRSLNHHYIWSISIIMQFALYFCQRLYENFILEIRDI